MLYSEEYKQQKAKKECWACVSMLCGLLRVLYCVSFVSKLHPLHPFVFQRKSESHSIVNVKLAASIFRDLFHLN